MGTDARSDIAVLELDDEAPADVAFAKFILVGRETPGNSLSVFGCPAGDRRGNHVDAEYKGLTGDWTIQIDRKNVVGAFIRGGYSGAAVWDVVLEGVVGMVSAAQTSPSVQLAYMIPVESLLFAWPDLPLVESIEELLVKDFVPSGTFRKWEAVRGPEALYDTIMSLWPHSDPIERGRLCHAAGLSASKRARGFLERVRDDETEYEYVRYLAGLSLDDSHP